MQHANNIPEICLREGFSKEWFFREMALDPHSNLPVRMPQQRGAVSFRVPWKSRGDILHGGRGGGGRRLTEKDMYISSS